MALEQKLSIRMSQRLIMTPSLQQAIKLLQMSKLELTEEIQQELDENPVLEETVEEPASARSGGEPKLDRRRPPPPRNPPATPSRRSTTSRTSRTWTAATCRGAPPRGVKTSPPSKTS